METYYTDNQTYVAHQRLSLIDIEQSLAAAPGDSFTWLGTADRDGVHADGHVEDRQHVHDRQGADGTVTRTCTDRQHHQGRLPAPAGSW